MQTLQWQRADRADHALPGLACQPRPVAASGQMNLLIFDSQGATCAEIIDTWRDEIYGLFETWHPDMVPWEKESSGKGGLDLRAKVSGDTTKHEGMDCLVARCCIKPAGKKRILFKAVIVPVGEHEKAAQGDAFHASLSSLGFERKLQLLDVAVMGLTPNPVAQKLFERVSGRGPDAKEKWCRPN